MVVLATAATGAHPFYVTVCQIDHNAETDSLEITLKFFTDDLEEELRGVTGERIRLARGRAPDDTDDLIHAYVRRKLALSADGTPLELRYVGKEVEIDETFVYVEVIDVPELTSLVVRSTILIGLYEDHDTIVHVRAGGEEKSLVLRKDQEVGSVEFGR